jgi:hypothetical protein
MSELEDKFDVEGLDEDDPRRRLNGAYKLISRALEDIDGAGDPPRIPIEKSRGCVVSFGDESVRLNIDGESIALDPGTATLAAFAIEAGVLDLDVSSTPEA